MGCCISVLPGCYKHDESRYSLLQDQTGDDGSVENLSSNILAAEQEFENFGEIRHQKIRIRVEVILLTIPEKNARPHYSGTANSQQQDRRTTPCNSPKPDECRNSENVGECSTLCNPPDTDELEECDEFSFPILI